MQLVGAAATLAVVVPLERNVWHSVFKSLAEDVARTEDIPQKPLVSFHEEACGAHNVTREGKLSGSEAGDIRSRTASAEEDRGFSAKDICGAVQGEYHDVAADGKQNFVTDAGKELSDGDGKADSENESGRAGKNRLEEGRRLLPVGAETGKIVKNRPRLLAISLYASGTPWRAATSDGRGRTSTMSDAVNWSNPGTEGDWNGSAMVVRNSPRHTDETVPLKHKLPVRFGVTVCYPLNERFGMESGLSYTYLSSNFSSSGQHYSYKVRQSLQYIGIPLNLKAVVWERKWVDFYLSVGGMAEKCMDGDSETDYKLHGKVESVTHRDVKEKPWQYSVNAGGGVQFNFSRAVGLYVEPGVSYHFDNGSSVSNIYKEKPWNFNMGLGLRFSLGL